MVNPIPIWLSSSQGMAGEQLSEGPPKQRSVPTKTTDIKSVHRALRPDAGGSGAKETHGGVGPSK